MMTQTQLLQYFSRIGYTPADEPEEEVLRNVHIAQAMHIPFENIDVYKNLGISLKPEDLFDKLVTRRRGGYCFELNSLLAMALRAMGFNLKRVSARLNMGGGFGGYAHCAAIVEAGGARYITDVGFGGGGFIAPVKLEPDTVQKDPGGLYKVIKDENFGYVVQWQKNGEFQNYMGIHDIEALDGDFDIGNYFTSTHPMSGFRKMLMCTMPTPSGRISITKEGLKITDNEEVTLTPLKSNEEYSQAFQKYLGIEATL